MAAYVISEVEILDEELAASYRELAARSIARHGGHYLARGVRPEALEGEWPDTARQVLVEFETIEAARDWYASPDYAEALAVAGRALRRRLVLVDGS